MLSLLIAFLAQSSSIVAPGATLQKLAGGFAFTEGPAADRNGDVYFTDQPNDRIVKWTPDGKLEDWMKPCGHCNGMRFDHHGNIIACADENNELWSISREKKVKVLIKDFGGKLLNGPNDIWIRPDGGIYVTDPLYPRPYWKRDPASQQSGQHVYYLAPGAGALVQETSDLQVPNGIIGTPDGKFLYVGDLGQSETFLYRIQKDGTLTDKTLFCNLGSDGMSIDDHGDIYISGHGVTVFDPQGTQILHVDVPEGWVGNLAFGGRNHKLLFIAASRGIYGLQMAVKGGGY
jgi:gluconolactonase